MRKVTLPLLIAVLGALLLPATAAHAHASLPPALEVGTTSTIPLEVPHERSAHNVEVAVRIPQGWQVADCATLVQETWSCALGSDSGFQTVTWTKDDDSDPADDETFRMRIRAAASVGTYSFPTVQIYSDGTEAAWIGPADSEEPAPVIRTVPRTGGPTTVLTTPPPTHTPTTRPPGPAPTTPGPTVDPGPGDPVPTVAPPDGPRGATTTTRPGATTTTSDRTDTTDEDATSTTSDRDDDGDPSDDDPTGGGGGGEIEEAGGPGLGATDDDADESNNSGLVVLALVVVVIGGAGTALFLRQRAVNRRTPPDDA